MITDVSIGPMLLVPAGSDRTHGKLHHCAGLDAIPNWHDVHPDKGTFARREGCSERVAAGWHRPAGGIFARKTLFHTSTARLICFASDAMMARLTSRPPSKWR
jgi:hypothetical protein